MAYDKVVDSSVLDTGLKQIADAIREKAGTSDNLAFPQAMADAIAAIEAGGGVKLTIGKFTVANDSYDLTINHGLNDIPDFFFLSTKSPTKTKGNLIYSCAFKESTYFTQRCALFSSTSAAAASYQEYDIESTDKYGGNPYGALYGATDTVIKFGASPPSASVTPFIKSATEVLWVAAKTGVSLPKNPEVTL